LSVFRFQLFDVIQSKNPLKVGTDSMLLGSFIDPTEAKSALDIGAGTGVLSLMVLQKNPHISLEAVEIHSEAAEECFLNFKNSPWGNSTFVHTLDFLYFQPTKQYDLIFSNPPFYLDRLKSGDTSYDQAKHISRETYEQFIRKTSELLSEDGRFYVIIPFDQFDYLCSLAEVNRLCLRQKITIHATEVKLNSRVILEFVKREEILVESALTVRLVGGEYTPEYIALTKNYHHTDLTDKN
jgi:tRNA1Val (adenine37-N6)-methyltransferase